MITFWLAAALLLVLALAFIIPPLLRLPPAADEIERERMNVRIHQQNLTTLRDDLSTAGASAQDLEQIADDLKQDLIADINTATTAADPGARQEPLTRVVLAVVLGTLIATASIGLYLHLGDAAWIDSTPPAAGNSDESAAMHAALAEMVEGLRARLQQQPDDAEGWKLLGRSYYVLERFAEAAGAYRHAHALIGDDPALLVDFAESLVLANGNQFNDESEALVHKALAVEPQNTKALWMAGHLALGRGDTTVARRYWQKLLVLLPAGGQEAELLSQQIRRLGSVPQTAASSDRPQAAAPVALKVTVTLEPALQERVAATDVVFIFARAVAGSRMPVAIVRKQVADLPVTVRLDDTASVGSGPRLSGVDEVVVGARISKTGNAMAASGDFEGYSEPLSPSIAAPVKIVIDKEVP